MVQIGHSEPSCSTDDGSGPSGIGTAAITQPAEVITSTVRGTICGGSGSSARYSRMPLTSATSSYGRPCTRIVRVAIRGIRVSVVPTRSPAWLRRITTQGTST